MKKNKKKRSKTENPEILREQSQNISDDDIGMTLFPGAFTGSTVSSTESTGLIQVIPFTPEQLGAYDDVYSYRRTKPTANRDKQRSINA